MATVTLSRGMPPTKLARSHKGLNQHQPYCTTKVWAAGRVIGCIRGGTFRKKVKASKHQLQKPPGWCISKRAFIEDIQLAAHTIVIEDTETGRLYECSVEAFAQKSLCIQRGRAEEQLCLPLQHWSASDFGSRQLLPLEVSHDC